MAGEAGELSELLSLHTATDKKRVPSTQSQNGDSKRPRHPPDTAFLPAPRKAQPDLDIEPFSGLRILPKARALSRDEVAALCQGFAVHKLESVPRLLVQPALGSWLTIGVLVDRGAAKVTQSGGKFCIWKVCDLRSNGTTMSIFLFGEACEVAWKYLPGSVLAIISARALPPKGSSAEAAMSINKQAQLVRIGQAADFGLCQGERRDGKPCGLWVNLSECEYCSFHVLAALRKSEKASKPSSQGSRTNGERARATCKPTQGRPPDTAAQKVKEAAQLLKSAGWELQPPDPNSSKPDHTRCLAPSASSNAQHDTLEIRVRRAGSSDKSLPIATTMRASKASQSRGRSNTQLDVFENAFGKVDVAAASQLLEERAIDDRCAEAVEEEEVDKRLRVMAKKDQMNEKVQQITQRSVYAFKCASCDYLSLTMHTECKRKGHTCRKLYVKQRWFECKKCRHHIMLLNKRLPENSCDKCHSMNWQEAGMRRSTGCSNPASDFLARGQEHGKFLSSH